MYGCIVANGPTVLGQYPHGAEQQNTYNLQREREYRPNKQAIDRPPAECHRSPLSSARGQHFPASTGAHGERNAIFEELYRNWIAPVNFVAV
ncbi:hypothetical protein MRX96_008200 [Rhipicephalus microplus]